WVVVGVDRNSRLLQRGLASACDGHAQECRGNGGRAGGATLVLGLEECVELTLQISGAAVLLGGIEGVDRRSVVVPKFRDELRGRTRKIEPVRVPCEGNAFLRN